MPTFAVIIYWIRILRRPIDARFKRRYVGEFTFGVGAAAVVWLWWEDRPSGFGDSYFWGELAGVVAVYLYSARPVRPRCTWAIRRFKTCRRTLSATSFRRFKPRSTPPQVRARFAVVWTRWTCSARSPSCASPARHRWHVPRASHDRRPPRRPAIWSA